MKYQDEAGALWRAYVPPRGQAATVQGELIRAVEKLRDEAQRNGNINWDAGFVILAKYLRRTLGESGTFSASELGEINADVTRLLDFEEPETSDEPFDRLTDRVVQWSRVHQDPVPHRMNPELRR